MPRRLLLLLAAALAACADAPAPEPDVEPPALADGEVAVPADSGAVAPRLTTGPDGQPVLSWVEPAGDGWALRMARWTGSGWAEPLTTDRGDDWFVNWADTPGVVVQSDGSVLSHTLLRHPGGSTYAYDVGVRTDGERRLLHTDGVAAEHGFVSGVALADGRAGLVWLDGRNQGAGHGHHSGAMTLRYATVGGDSAQTDEVELDARTCDCCPTAMVTTPSGPVVAYRDRSDDEVRDVAVVRQVEGAWTEPAIPHADGWRIEGCPVNGPALAAAGDHVALAWFAGGDSTRVWLSVSGDAGATWGDRVRVDGGAPLGRVGVALLADGSAAVSWLENVGDDAELRVRRVGADGSLRPAVTVATVDAGRSSGVPHVAALGDRALVAWTDSATATVRTAVVSP
ncbi:hypothetical protein [Rubrivirga sp.]|uniref:hypothetical protein n=1 Tax=Rubrivirga sp. TaxID=1885344 RepID=UPI003B522535